MITVVTRSHFKPADLELMEDLTKRSIPIFESQKGFISMQVNKAFDNSGTITIFRWNTLEDHENCMKSTDWDKLNGEWNTFFEREGASFEFLFIGTDWKSNTA